MKMLASCCIVAMLLVSGCVGKVATRVTVVETPDLSDRDLSENEYSDLLVAVRVQGEWKEPKILLLPVLDERKELLTATIRVGDELRVEIMTADEVPERWERAQRIDELTGARSGNELYGARTEFISRGPEKHTSIAERRKDGKQVRIDASQAEIFSAIKRHGGSEEVWMAELAPFRESAAQSVSWEGGISEAEALALRVPEFRSPVNGSGISPIEAVTSLANQLEAKGLSFLYLSIPLRTEIYPEWFGGSPDLETGAARLDFLRLLGETGVEFFDAALSLKAEKLRKGDDFQPFWRAADAHLTPQGHAVLARALAVYLEDNGWLENLEKVEFEAQSIKVSAPGHPEMVMDARQSILPKTNSSSPIFLAGDSNLFFYQTLKSKGCGLPSQLAVESGHYVDWKSIAGMQPHTFGKYGTGVFHGKKLVIFLHTAWLLHDERSPMMPVVLQEE